MANHPLDDIALGHGEATKWRQEIQDGNFVHRGKFLEVDGVKPPLAELALRQPRSGLTQGAAHLYLREFTLLTGLPYGYKKCSVRWSVDCAAGPLGSLSFESFGLARRSTGLPHADTLHRATKLPILGN